MKSDLNTLCTDARYLCKPSAATRERLRRCGVTKSKRHCVRFFDDLARTDIFSTDVSTAYVGAICSRLVFLCFRALEIFISSRCVTLPRFVAFLVPRCQNLTAVSHIVSCEVHARRNFVSCRPLKPKGQDVEGPSEDIGATLVILTSPFRCFFFVASLPFFHASLTHSL